MSHDNYHDMDYKYSYKKKDDDDDYDADNSCHGDDNDDDYYGNDNKTMIRKWEIIYLYAIKTKDVLIQNNKQL